MSTEWTLRDAVKSALYRVSDRPGRPSDYPDTFLAALEEFGWAVVRVEHPSDAPETPESRRLNCPVCGSGEFGDCVCPLGGAE